MNDEISSPMAVLLEEARRKRNLSERQLAQEIDVAHTTVGRVLRGQPVDIVTIQKIAAWMGVETASLFKTQRELVRTRSPQN